MFLFFHFFTQAQTKSETESWIIKKATLYSFKNSYDRVTIINDGYLYYNKIDTKTNIILTERILLKSIDKIEVYGFRSADGEKLYSFKLNCKSGFKCVEFYSESSKGFVKDMDHMNLYFNKNFEEDNMPKRFLTALQHLIKLNGGQATEKKETF